LGKERRALKVTHLTGWIFNGKEVTLKHKVRVRFSQFPFVVASLFNIFLNF